MLTEEGEDDQDQDSLKEALLETSPYLLGATVLVSILHSVFELLAFKNGNHTLLHLSTSDSDLSEFEILFNNRCLIVGY